MRPDDQLQSLLRWNPIPHGDPGPEIYLLFQVLDSKRQLQIAGTLIEAKVKTADIASQTYKPIAAVLKEAGPGR